MDGLSEAGINRPMGVPELESGTSSLSATRSNQLSYTPDNLLCAKPLRRGGEKIATAVRRASHIALSNTLQLILASGGKSA
jgi:hypothetical protein